MLKYLVPFLTSFILTIILIIAAIPLSKKIKWRGRVSSRHIHTRGTLRIGGVVLILAFTATIFFNNDLVLTSELLGLIFGSIALLLVGFLDDLREISWKIQLFSQIALSILIFIIGIRIYYITNPFVPGGIINLNSDWGVIISAILVILWIMLVINSLNWSDGIDGLSGGISLIASATIFILSLKPQVNQPTIAIISAIFGGAVLAFLIFNFHPAKILAGTSGSMFMGFAIAVMAIFAGTKIATALLVFTIPVIDFLWVISERIKKGKSIFRADKNHLHHKLMELGWSQRKIVLIYWLITAIIAVFALNTRAFGKGLVFFTTALIIIIVLAVIERKILSVKKMAN